MALPNPMRTVISRIRHMRGLKLSSGIGACVAIQLISAFAVQIVVLRIVGAGPETDAFIAAQTLPLLAATIIGTALQGIWQPRLAIAAADDRHAELERAWTMGCLFIIPIAAVLAVLASVFTELLFVGFSSGQVELTAKLTRIALVATVFNVLSLVLAAGGRAVGRFAVVEAIPAALGLLAVAGVAFVVPRMGVEGATWVLALRGIANFLVLWALLGCPLLRDPRDDRSSSTARGILTLMGGSSLYKLGPLVDRYWSSQGTAGAVTLYNLAQSGMGAVATLLERAIALPAVPGIARALEARDLALVRLIYRRALALVWATTLACLAVGGLVASTALPIVMEVLRLTDDQSVLLIQLGIALGGFLGVAAGGTVVNSIFYAAGDVRTPVLVGVGSFVVGVLLKSFAFVASGLVAMALATSAYYVMAMAISIYLIERKLHEIGS